MHTPTLAHFKRTMTPGTRLRITNHVRPAGSRDTRVHEKTNTVDLVTWAQPPRGTDVAAVSSHLGWPAAKNLRGDESPNVFHIDREGIPFVTIEDIGDDHPEAATWPTTFRTA